MPNFSVFPDLRANAALYLAIVAVIVVLLLARRVRVIRVTVNIALTATLGALLVLAVSQRARFDPYFSRIAGIFNLGGQQVVGKEVRIRMSPDGHFWARVKVDGVERRMLIDSGATVTALSSTTASAAGLKFDAGILPIVLETANGAIPAQTSTVKNLRLGDIAARDLPVVVSPAFGDTDVLGMNFLSKLQSWRVEDATLVLVPHHPQDEV